MSCVSPAVPRPGFCLPWGPGACLDSVCTAASPAGFWEASAGGQTGAEGEQGMAGAEGAGQGAGNGD